MEEVKASAENNSLQDDINQTIKEAELISQFPDDLSIQMEESRLSERPSIDAPNSSAQSG